MLGLNTEEVAGLRCPATEGSSPIPSSVFFGLSSPRADQYDKFECYCQELKPVWTGKASVKTRRMCEKNGQSREVYLENSCQ